MPRCEADVDIARVLASCKTVAVLGASNKPARPSYSVMGYLLDQGYEIFPVNPGLAGQEILGRLVYANLCDIPVRVDMVDVFRQSQYLPDIVREAIACGVGVLWTQLGVVDESAALAAETSGITVVMDRCPAIEGPRLTQLGLLKPSA